CGAVEDHVRTGRHEGPHPALQRDVAGGDNAVSRGTRVERDAVEGGGRHEQVGAGDEDVPAGLRPPPPRASPPPPAVKRTPPEPSRSASALRVMPAPGVVVRSCACTMMSRSE